MLEHDFKKAFDKFYNAPIEAWKHFANQGDIVDYKKNQIIKTANSIDKFGYFLLEGSVGLFAWKQNSLACIDLFLEHNFFADDISLNSGNPSPIQIVALEKSKIFRIGKSKIEELKTTPMGSLLFMIGDQNAYAEKQRQQVEFMTLTPEQRYLSIVNDNPEIIKRIHQKHIASYLGITTQSLSRIRKRINI